MNDKVVQGSGALEYSAVSGESSGRDWAGIGVGLAAAFALIAILCAGIWAVLILVQAA